MDFDQIEKINSQNCVDEIKKFLLDLQNRIFSFLQVENGSQAFKEDKWQHQQGGFGITRVLTGDVIEKAGVNFSHVHGLRLPQAATLKRPELANLAFQAMGVSVVTHPMNPYVPTSHMNVRFILVEREHHPIWWFGGGFDLTPYYGFKEDCIHWHQMAKNACDPFGEDRYAKYKKWADDYFFLKHRNEPRGIGGIFFDDLNDLAFSQSFAFMQNVANHYIKAYQPILMHRKLHPYGEQEKNFQLYRRGRYVEFNLIYDRGTHFGLQSGGRTESILMSLPPLVAWHYDFKSQPDSKEAKLYEEFLQPREWL